MFNVRFRSYNIDVLILSITWEHNYVYQNGTYMNIRQGEGTGIDLDFVFFFSYLISTAVILEYIFLTLPL